jgi:hypothetical protein
MYTNGRIIAECWWDHQAGSRGGVAELSGIEAGAGDVFTGVHAAVQYHYRRGSGALTARTSTVTALFGRIKMTDADELVYHILMRPRMHLPHIRTVRDLLIFVAGVNCGLHPPYAGHMLISFEQFLKKRLGSATSDPQQPFTLGALAQKLVGELCERIAELYKEWVVSGTCDEPVNADLSVYEGSPR